MAVACVLRLRGGEIIFILTLYSLQNVKELLYFVFRN